MMPGTNVRKNFFRSPIFMGCRFVRNSSSSVEGGGTWFKSQRKRRSGPIKRQQATHGIQYSEVPQSRMIKPPTDLANPAEKIKLTERPAPRTSVNRLPSR